MSPASTTARRRAALGLAFAAVYLFWGATFLATRYVVAEIPPLLSVTIRCLGGALLLYLWLRARGALLRLTRPQWRTAAIASVFLFLGCQGLLAWSERRVSSGHAAVVMTSIPLWMVIAESVRERRPPGWRALVALVLGAVGVGTLAAGDAWSARPSDLAALTAGAFCWAIGSVIVRAGDQRVNPTLSTAAMLALGGLWAALAAVAAGEPSRADLAAITARGAVSLSFLVVCSTVLAVVAYAWLLRETSAVAAGTYAYVNPMVALLLGWAAGDERLTATSGLAALLVVSAVVAARPSEATPPNGTVEARRLAPTANTIP